MGWGNESGLWHMTKMVAIPIFGKKPLKIFFSGTKRMMTFKLNKQHCLLEYYQLYSNHDPGLTLIYFTARSNLVSFACVWENA